MTHDEIYADPDYVRIKSADEICPEGALNLATAILRQACFDYAAGLTDDNHAMIRDCETFFDAPETLVLTSANPTSIKEAVKKHTIEFDSISNRHFLFGTISRAGKPAFKCPICGDDVFIRRKLLYRPNFTDVAVYGREARCHGCHSKRRVADYRVRNNAEE